MPAVELSGFDDKRLIVTQLCKLDHRSTLELIEVVYLRNAVTHPQDYARTDAQLDTFIDRLALSKKWIRRLAEQGGAM